MELNSRLRSPDFDFKELPPARELNLLVESSNVGVLQLLQGCDSKSITQFDRETPNKLRWTCWDIWDQSLYELKQKLLPKFTL